MDGGMSGDFSGYLSDDNDISWLTQVPRNEYNFNIADNFLHNDMNLSQNVISLEEDYVVTSRNILYDNIEVEDISSDEVVDQM